LDIHPHLLKISCNHLCMTYVLTNRTDYCGYAFIDTKSHVSKNSKVTMYRLLGGVLSELVLILLNLDFEIDRS
jgi:hypothetical protein